MGFTLEEAAELRTRGSEAYVEKAKASMAEEVEAMLAMQKTRRRGLRLRQQHPRRAPIEAGCERAFDIPGFVPAYIRPLFCVGQGPVPLGRALGRSGGHRRHRPGRARRRARTTRISRRWIELAKERVKFQGLPARICWLGYGDRAKVGLAFNELVRTGKVKAPIVIGRDHLDCGSVASPNRETEAMKDGTDAIADWAILNALVNTAAGASWVSFHHGGGVGMGYSSTRAWSSSPTARPRPRAPRARAHERSGHGRHPPRRRGLRGGDRVREGQGRARPAPRALRQPFSPARDASVVARRRAVL